MIAARQGAIRAVKITVMRSHVLWFGAPTSRAAYFGAQAQNEAT
jgi:hypothetical protein